MRRFLLLGVVASASCDLYDPLPFGARCEQNEDCAEGLACLESTATVKSACETGKAVKICSRSCFDNKPCADLPGPAGRTTVCGATCEKNQLGGSVEAGCRKNKDMPWMQECPGVCF